ncbi:hypothetical protein HPB47_003499 [Ixodes persulcatus]|uniref:Uncharacterized protein n=1 Tax=Ixodes persulcatus TaxID=34615 RepID=A0AC60PJX0_IXOPE|nr:hypothetical protein HPB47_003499 [Ixodes persulcatus]
MATATPSLTASQKTPTERYSMPPSTCGSSIAELENEASVTNLAEVRAPDHGLHISPPNAEMLTSDMEIADTNQASVTCERAEEAEEIAVALTLTDPACKTVLCDSRQVIRNFARGRISLRAARIISQRQVHREPEPPTRLLWFPAHGGEVSEEHRNGNETAHARARELTNRTGDGRPWYSSKDRMTSYNEITKAFRLARRTLPPPSDKLDRAQAVALRQLQTRTYPNPAQYYRIFPEIYTTNTCKVCRKEVATLTHMLWDCTKNPHGANSGTLPPRLSAALCSPSLDDQL